MRLQVDERDTDARPKPLAYDHPGEFIKTASGIVVPEPGTLRTWIKFAGEPAEVLFEPPDIFTTRWLAFCHDESAEVCWVHTYTDGQAFAIFRSAIPHLWKVGITFQSTPPRHTRSSVWIGACPCPGCSQ